MKPKILIKINCTFCNKELIRDESYIKNKKAWGKHNFFCDSHCARRYNFPTPNFILKGGK